MSIFRNRYQIRHVHNNASHGTWESVVVGVFSRPGRIPVLFGIEMRYEVGDAPIRALDLGIDNDMQLLMYPIVLLTQEQTYELARTGVIQIEEGVVQLLASKSY